MTPSSPWNLCSKWPTPYQKPQFWPTSAPSASTVRAGEKRSIIANKKSTTRFPSSHRWTLCVTPKSPKGWLKTRVFTFGVAFHFFVAGNRRHFKFNMWVEHSTSQPTEDKLSLKGSWSLSRDLFNFWKIGDNISKTVRDSVIVSIKFEQEVVCALSNGYVADNLRWPLSTLNHLNFYILHCLMHLRNWWSQSPNLMYRLNLQVTAYGRQVVPDNSVIRSCDLTTPLKMFRAPIISLKRLNLKSSNYVHT